MKKLLMRTAIRTVVLVFVVYAGVQGMETRKFGIGLMVGAPTGISFKYWLNEVNALTGGISLGSDAAIQLNYLWHNFGATRPREGSLPVHYGFGAQAQSGGAHSGDHSRIGLRGVIGLTYLFEKAPFDVFAELAPLLEIGNNSELRLTASVGARYFF
ncbi:MAG: hypothetical protein KJ967_02925 [Elusimicrobia bacterium]|nr:hypothetical protein [Elusimicrobiota bacterium]